MACRWLQIRPDSYRVGGEQPNLMPATAGRALEAFRKGAKHVLGVLRRSLSPQAKG